MSFQEYLVCSPFSSQTFIVPSYTATTPNPTSPRVISKNAKLTFDFQMHRGYHIRITLCPQNPASTPESFIPASLFQPLPSHSTKSSVRRNTLSRTTTETKDYRTGPITLDWTDFDHMTSVMHSAKDRNRARGVFISKC